VSPYILHARWNIFHREGTMSYSITQFTHLFKKMGGLQALSVEAKYSLLFHVNV
jgi:hypothetical protein